MPELNVTTEILDVDEARRRLPAVRAEVETLMQVTQELRAFITAHGEEEKDYEPEQEAALRGIHQRFVQALERLNALGATLKDPEIGLIDFYTWRGDDLVFLCWKHGEQDITHWHGLKDGFAGRQLL